MAFYNVLVEFSVLRDMGQVKSENRILNFREANFQLFKKLVNKTLRKCPRGQGSNTELTDL